MAFWGRRTDSSRRGSSEDAHSTTADNNPPSMLFGDRADQHGGYDFGGYVPGEDYLPKKQRRALRWVFGGIAIIIIIALFIYFMF
ncbi:hypothetical protein ACU21_06010 [Actinobaculum suis]|nr:hypothetical protein [Actinobaculum suis]KMY22914.1 hypothetical protein ACU19_07075 [Actinobaculum suis]OCA94741.1 hypothetical protein ACU21_06010 [Actinobaculum suis]OCA95529.1 hypothetical protein ACU20_03895 [Actinobaculum suis]